MNKCIKIIPVIILIILSAFACFYKLSSPPLEIWDEYTNFNVIYYTIESSQSTVLYNSPVDSELHLDQKSESEIRSQRSAISDQPFLEKPPLWYWLTIVSVKIFGFNRFAVRFASALSGFLLILTIAYTGYKMSGYKAGLSSGFITLGIKHFFLKYEYIFSTHNFRSADLDSLQLLFMMLSVLTIYEFRNSKRKSWLVLTGILTGLGIMTKGPFSLLPILVYTVLKIFSTKNKKKPLLDLFTVFCSLLTIILPWHLFMSVKFGKQFWDNYLFYHIISRSTSSIEGHFGDIFFYPRLLFHRHFFVFGEFLIGAIMFLVFKYKRATSFTHKYCFTGFILSFLIITFVQTKLTWYIFYSYPFMILLIGKSLSDIAKLKNTATKLIIQIPSIAVVALSIIRNLYLIAR